MLEYPKIDTLLERGDDFKVTPRLKRPEYALIDKWHVTEKIHGSNIRVDWNGEVVSFAGRTTLDIDIIKGGSGLREYLESRFTPDRLTEHFGCLGDSKHPSSYDSVTLFGEGCGAGIQKGGAYSPDKIFVLFDVLIGKWWLEPRSITDIAHKFSVYEAPLKGFYTLQEIVDMVRDPFQSTLADAITGTKYAAEGVIARTVPGLFNRHGDRLMFKLKTKDFAPGAHYFKPESARALQNV